MLAGFCFRSCSGWCQFDCSSEIWHKKKNNSIMRTQPQMFKSISGPAPRQRHLPQRNPNNWTNPIHLHRWPCSAFDQNRTKATIIKSTAPNEEMESGGAKNCPINSFETIRHHFYRERSNIHNIMLVLHKAKIHRRNIFSQANADNARPIPEPG